MSSSSVPSARDASWLGAPLPDARLLDDPALLEASYRLRFNVYCLERQFLEASRYPTEMETDEFDEQSIHLGALDDRDELIGTARLILRGPLGLPIFRHCAIAPEFAAVAALPGAAEISRLSVSRDAERDDARLNRRGTRRQRERVRPGAVRLAITKVLYQASKGLGVTHWLVAIEPSLYRILVRSGLPFVQIGPATDYLGTVAPYLMALADLDEIVARGERAALRTFNEGLDSTMSALKRTNADGRWHNVADPPARPPDRAPRDPVIDAFRRAAAMVPAYRVLLDEHQVDPGRVVDAVSYGRHAPLLDKSNTFDRFSLDELSVGGRLPPLADVLTSSGHGGRFSFGVTTREQASLTAEMVDTALDAAFAIRTRTTLIINCLPMGVVVSSNCATVATTSVREDMAVALVRAFGPRYEQIVLVSDPLFLKRLLDHARESGVDWRRYSVNVVIGEETFGEQFRRYVAGQLGLDAADRGRIISSFGVGELGLHLCFETAATVAARQALLDRPALARDLLGEATLATTALPMLFTYVPARTHMECVDTDAHGFGRLAVSMLDPALPIPLLRYLTGDVARRLEPDTFRVAAARHGVELPADLPTPLLAVRGREREALPGGHVAVYKDALYADTATANRLSGAVRLVADASGCTMHVQLAIGVAEEAGIGERIAALVPPAARPSRVVVWSYGCFPYGMQLDYERKFTYFAPAATRPALETTGVLTS